MIFSISGVSGGGKTVLLEWLLGIIKPSGFIPSDTTRGRRPSDIGEYNYITPAQFRQLKEDNEFAWFVDKYGNQYGTKKEDIYQAVLAAEKIKKVSMLLIVPKTILKLRQYVRGNGGEVISFYIHCNDEDILRQRLMERDNDIESVERRIKDSRDFFEQASNINGLHWIDNSANDDLVSAKRQILRVLREEGFRSLQIYGLP